MDASQTARELELIGTIYDAVSEPALWSKFLGACLEHVDALSASFGIRDLYREEFSVGGFAGWADEDVRIYMERYNAIDPLSQYAQLQPEGVIVPDYEFCPREVAESSVVFREFYIPHDRMHTFGGMILCTPRVQSFVCFFRGKAGGPFTHAECSKLRPLLPHLRRAALLHDELQNLRMRNTAFTAHLDRIQQPLCLLDAERRVLYSNSTAADLLSRRDGLRIEFGQLAATSIGETNALEAAIHAALGDESAGRTTISRSPEGLASYRLFLFPLPGFSQLTFGTTHPVLAALIVDTATTPEIDYAVIRELFGLTQAEAQIAGKLSQGLGLGEIAAELCISFETARTHLRRILAKTGTNRQGALVSLILRTAPYRNL